jgi:hypothetical protein
MLTKIIIIKIKSFLNKIHFYQNLQNFKYKKQNQYLHLLVFTTFANLYNMILLKIYLKVLIQYFVLLFQDLIINYLNKFQDQDIMILTYYKN